MNPNSNFTLTCYPFGMPMPGRNGAVSGGEYRYGFNGQEKDDEVAGSGNIYSAEFWMYDSRLAHRWNIDPKPNASVSVYAVLQGNPIWFTDHNGDTVRVTTSKGVYLFSLDDGKPEIMTVTAKQVYDAGYQWFEPEADKYVPLLHVNPDITKMSELKHFTWEQIALFANRDWSAGDFFQKGAGDWKQSPEGADGFFLVTVNGMPYWSDAVGQIPFAAWYAKTRLEKHGDENKAVEETLNQERDWGSGTLFGSRDNDNSYDHYFALRGAKAAMEAYDKTKEGALKLDSNFKPSESSLNKPANSNDAKIVQKTGQQ